MPNMINHHYDHSLVVVKEKLFVIGSGRERCEVFDNVCNKFVSLKNPPSITLNKCMAIDNKIFVFQHNRSTVICYDVDKDEWSKESCEVTQYREYFSLTKLPQY